MLIQELKAKLAQLNLPTTGTKAVLEQRLRQSQLSKQGSITKHFQTVETGQNMGKGIKRTKSELLSSSSSDSGVVPPAATSEKTATTTETVVKGSPKKRRVVKSAVSSCVDNTTTAETSGSTTVATASLTKEEILKDTVPFVRRTKDSEFLASEMYKFISWNVNGLNAMTKNARNYLQTLIQVQKPDILCLQETKLQQKNAESVGVLPGYKMYSSCSKTKLGYSGTRIYVKDSLPAVKVYYGLVDGKHNDEGRVITVELPELYLVNTYVPNAGMQLERLKYRVETWDPAMAAYLQQLQQRDPTKGVIWTGDLNVAEKDYDRYFAGTYKLMQKCAGFTPEERKSFRALFLGKCQLVDTFRLFYPKAAHVYSFWGHRQNCRASNSGWRLDYFLVSSPFVGRVLDTFMLPDVLGSDHCPVVMWLKK